MQHGDDAQNPTAKVAIRDVSLTYQPRRGSPVVALSNVSLSVPENELCVIVGASGCGKSTLLRLVAGLLHPTAGDILVDGKPVGAPKSDRGMVFQSYSLFPWLSVKANIEFGSQVRGMRRPQREEVVRRYIDLVGLQGFEDTYPRGLSGGMQQRVAIARALANDPEVILMDEPFGALDAQTRLTMQQLLLDVWGRSRKTILFVTHDIDEALLLGDRVVVMASRPGRIITTLPVELPRPRTLALRGDPVFLAVREQIASLIRDQPVVIT